MAPVLSPAYYRAQAKALRALGLGALTLVTRLHLLALCRAAVRLAEARQPAAVPRGRGGRPRSYTAESLLLLALLRVLWRLSYAEDGGELGRAGFAVADILAETVRLNGTVRATAVNLSRGDTNGDGLPEASFQFPRDALDPFLSIGANRLEVSGSLVTGEVFRGSAVVKVLVNSSTQIRAASLHVVSPPGTLPVEIATGAPVGHARTLAVYDIQGRLVKRWTATAGVKATWDGARSDGRRAGAGIYLVRSEDGAAGVAIKVAIVR